MSEYQYYEFQAVDRPLTPRAMRELRAYSSRARITATSFVNEYHWGDLKADPLVWMEKYFDAFLYEANWGARWLMLRLPREVLDLKTARQYCRGASARAKARGDFVILSFRSDGDSGEGSNDDDTGEGTGRLASLISLRAEIARGDHRALYLAWLLCAQEAELKPSATEPRQPPGMRQLTASLRAFMDFLRIDEDLVAVSALDRPTPDDEPTRNDLRRLVEARPDGQKVSWLVQVATGGGDLVRADILRRIDRTPPQAKARARKPRTVSELLALARGEASSH
jgi:hypothetical protein